MLVDICPLNGGDDPSERDDLSEAPQEAEGFLPYTRRSKEDERRHLAAIDAGDK